MARFSPATAWLGALCLCLAGVAQAQSTGAPEAKAAATPARDWTGYVGAGALAFPKYVGGKGSTVWPVPLLSFEYKETFYVDLLRAGVRLWSSADQKVAIGLAAEPRFGYKSSDGARLAGMGERHLSIEAGPSLEWETPLVLLNLAYFADITGSSKGGSLHGTAYKQIVDTPKWDVGPYVGFERIDTKAANYYFGVTPAEAIAGRPAYQAGASTNWNIGLSGAYKFSKPYALMFGVQNTHLGNGAGASPIVETRNATMGYIGLGWTL
ncbi:MAG TPA: MipA/OmpV family protein [Burkholderiales bacterium]|nr:MipA/OmpV family protein [Burkholderiales bacterium]